MDKEAFGLLMEYNWPGNVRELINVIEYTFVLCPGGEIVPDHLPTTLTTKPHPLSAEQPKAREHRRSADEKKRLLKALKRTGGNKSETARTIGISRVTLWKRLKAYDIHVVKRIQG